MHGLTVLMDRFMSLMDRFTVLDESIHLFGSEIDKIYGNCVRSRLREMFNPIAFDVNSLDKRT
jgi:hypothetical protein